MNKEKIHPASSVITIREHNNTIQTLLLQRNQSLAFAPGMWVFAGGKIEESDFQNAQHNQLNAEKIAAIRECFEETHINLHGIPLIPFSHWTTPPIHPKRFATQFFLTQVPNDTHVQIDNSEIVDFTWLTPQQAIEQHQQGRLPMMPPAYVSLHELAQFKHCQQALEHYTQQPPKQFTPKPNKIGNTYHLLYQGDAGYQDNDANNTSQLHRCIMNQQGILTYQFAKK